MRVVVFFASTVVFMHLSFLPSKKVLFIVLGLIAMTIKAIHTFIHSFLIFCCRCSVCLLDLNPTHLFKVFSVIYSSVINMVNVIMIVEQKLRLKNFGLISDEYSTVK